MPTPPTCGLPIPPSIPVATTAMEDRAVTDPVNPRSFGSWWLPIPWVPSEQRLTPHESLTVGTVWACAQLIATSLASSPWNVFEVSSDGRRKKLPQDSLAYLLNVRPNPEAPAVSVREALVLQALLGGDGYAEVERDGAGRCVALWPIISDRALRPTRDADGRLVYEFVNASRGVTRLAASDVLHIRGLSLDGLCGQGTVLAAVRAIAFAAACERFGSAYLANAATPSGILTVQSQLNEPARAALRESFEDKYQGTRASGRPLILPPGVAWTGVSAHAKDAQLIEASQFAVEQVARFFGVPLVLIGVPAASVGYGSNVEQLGLGFVRFTLTPWALRLSQEVDAKCIPARVWKSTALDLSHLAWGTEKERAEADEVRIRSGVLTINEVREVCGRNHSDEPGCDEHLILTTVQPLSRCVEPPEPPAPAAPPPGSPSRSAEAGQDAGSDDEGASNV